MLNIGLVWIDWQDATYYYGNIAPQWQSINNGNWRRLENSIRAKGKKLYRDLEIFSGITNYSPVLIKYLKLKRELKIEL